MVDTRTQMPSQCSASGSMLPISFPSVGFGRLWEHKRRRRRHHRVDTSTKQYDHANFHEIRANTLLLAYWRCCCFYPIWITCCLLRSCELSLFCLLSIFFLSLSLFVLILFSVAGRRGLMYFRASAFQTSASLTFTTSACLWHKTIRFFGGSMQDIYVRINFWVRIVISGD